MVSWDSLKAMNEHEYTARIRAEQDNIRRLFENAEIAPTDHRCGGVRSNSQAQIGRYFDHTLLQAGTVFEQIDALCREALELNVHSVCIPPDRITQATAMLAGSSVSLCSVVGFPHGYTTVSAKVAETQQLLENGCDEFDTVIRIGALLDDDLLNLYQDIHAVVEAAPTKVVKVILETAYLSPLQIIRGGLVAIWAGAAMLKTSTGYAHAGATIDNVKLLRAIAGERVGVKAAGGIRDWEFARACIAAGADRLGTSQTCAILKGAVG